MPLAVERFDAREWPDEVLEPIFADAFPPFIGADKVAALYIDRVREYFADLNIILLDETDQPVACGRGVPIAWNGELNDLPTGYTLPPPELSYSSGLNRDVELLLGPRFSRCRRQPTQKLQPSHCHPTLRHRATTAASPCRKFSGPRSV